MLIFRRYLSVYQSIWQKSRVASVVALGLALFFSGRSTPSVAQSTGLVAAYGFNEGSGTTVTDLSGNNLTGSLGGATWTTGGRFGNALSFNGTSARVTVPDAAPLDVTSAMTLEAWVLPTSSINGWRAVMHKDIDRYYLFASTDNQNRPGTGGTFGATNQNVFGTATLPLNSWTHLAATYDRTTIRLYVNGVQVASGAQTAAVSTSNAVLTIGADYYGEYFAGLIDEVRIYNRALAPIEIQNDMNTPVGGAPPPPDGIPPVVSMSAPLDAATVAGTISVSASATDNVGVAGVQFRLDGVNLGPEITGSGPTYTYTWNTATSGIGAHTLAAVARDLGNITTTSQSIAVTVTNPSGAQIGGWSTVQNWPIVAVHASLLPTGNVLAWTDYTANNGAQIWRPATNTFSALTYAAVSLFCSGHAFLADGRLMIAGGIVGLTDDIGPHDSTIFDPVTETWSPSAFMAMGRYYPTTTTLGDGRIFVQGGTTTCTSCVADVPEIFDPVVGNWTQMASSARMAFQYYPHSFLLPDGRIIVTGQDDRAISTQVLDLNTQAWTTIDSRVLDGHSSAMYLPGKIVKAGKATVDFSGLPSVATTYDLDMTQSNPAWHATAPMAFPRSYLNLTVLPDGQVLATGGGTTTDPANFATAVYEAELWSPTTKTWTTMGRMQTPRLYHSTALLLPDARVLVAGGGRQNGRSQPDPKDQPNAEIFSPPYLFKGPRPVISSAPAVLSYNLSFTVQTPDSARIASVSLIALGAVTHAFNENQRFVPLTFQQGSGSLNILGPINGNAAPPGPYMLFLVDSTGVPSVAAMVRLPAPGEDSQPPTAPGNLTATASTGTISLNWSASIDNIAVTAYNIHRSTTPGFTPTSANKIGQALTPAYTDTNLSAGGTYYYRVTAQDAKSNVSPSSNETFASVVLDTTTPTVSITSPAPGATLGAIVSIQVAASDNVAVAGVQFLLDGANLGAEVSGPGPNYTFSWNTSTVANGSHTLSARARDGAGNSSVASNVGVVVSNVPPTGLVAAYTFDEGAGATVTDLSGNNLTGTVVGATWTTGKYGNALAFNGTSAKVTVPDAAPLDVTNAMTLEAWVFPTSALSGWRSVMHKDIDRYYLFASTDNQNRPGTGGTFGTTNQNVFGTATLPLNTWTHLSATYDRTTIRLFVNGAQVASSVQTVAISTSNAVLTIGADSYGENFAGLIDEVRIYNRALTPIEIQTDMNMPVAPRLIVAQPAAGESISGTTVTVAYSASGNLTGVDHVHFQLDSLPEVMDRDFDGNYQFSNVSTGAHVLRGYLVRADHSKIFGTDASVNFSTTVSDTTAPTISMISPADGATATGTIVLTASAADETAMAGVQFLLDGASLGAEVTGSGPGYSFSWNTSAVANGPHTISARARDNGNNTATAAGVAVVVSNDTTLPAVSVTTPIAGAAVNGTIDIVVSAADNVAMAGVQFLLDGVNLGAEVAGTGPTFSYSWNTTTATNGPHTLSARARDAANNTATAAGISIAVANADSIPPTASITTPVAGSTLTGTTAIVVSAADNVAISGVQFLLDGADLGAVVTGAGPTYTYSWNTSASTNGPHTLSAHASDTAGNIVTATSIVITVSNDTIAPTVSVTSPSDGSTVSGTAGLTASASDNVAMAGVQLLLDGSNLGAELIGAGPTYSFNWNSTTATNGPHTISARARDTAGNTSISGTIGVNVSNVAPSGLMAAYSFNEGTGTTVADVSGNNQTGSVAGATWTTGRYGNALTFNGTNSRVTIPDAAPLDVTNAMTLEAWVFPTSALSGWRAVMHKDVDRYYLFASTDNQNRPGTGATFGTTNQNVFGTATLPINTWTHLAATYDRTTIRLYINGVQMASGAQTAPVSTSNAVLTIGADFYGEYFAGLIDEVRIYNRALAPNEILADMDVPISGTPPPPDGIPPTVSISSPLNGASVAGSISVSASAADNLGVAGVQFLLDGANLGAEVTGAGPTYTYTWNTATSSVGTHTLSARARDGANNIATATDIVVSVTSLNSTPTITNINDVSVVQNTATGAISFAVSDLETPAANLTVTGSSNNPTLVPAGNIVFGGSGSNRTVTVTPAANLTGTSIITVTVSDGALSASDTFVVTVNPPTITVTAPNTAVSWKAGTTQNVTFTHSLGVGHLVNIEVSRDAGTTWTAVGTLTTTSATSGTYPWLVSGPSTTQALIRVRSASLAVSDISNSNFTITLAITVTAPNTAVTWAAGSLRTITWTHTLGSSQAFDIDFSPDNGTTWTPMTSGVPAATATTGTYAGLMPATLTTQALVRVSPAGLTINGDVSNLVFSVVAPTITVSAPNTNVNWAIGSAHSITWTHNLGTAESVKIEVSRDGGSTWTVVTSSLLNSGSTSSTFSWTVTGPASTAARIRVSSSSLGISDMSNVNFRIQ